MKPYPAYKDSGIEWVGKIPKEWKPGKVKHNVLIVEKTGLHAAEGKKEGLYPFFTSSQTQDKFINKAIIHDECLILGNGGSASIHYMNGKFSASNDCLVLKRQKNIIIKFLYYLLFSNIKVIDDLGFNGIGLRHLQRVFFDNMLIYFPPIQEQLRIASYLDRKTAQIDELISKKEKIIELLKEERVAIINEAVTKGLNPNAEMKDSGIEWLGKIPKHWEVERLKSACTFAYGDSLSNEYRIEGNVPVYGSNGIVGCHNKAITEKPCIIIGRKGSFGKINFSEAECFPIDTTYFIDSRFAKCDLKWLNYVLSLLELDMFSNDTGVPGLNRDNAHNKKIPLPNINEQKIIADYLDRKTAEIDSQIENMTRAIGCLKEYRTALISEVVTGKIDVRGYAV